MKFTNDTDQPVSFRRTHRFGDERPTVITVQPGESLPLSQVHAFERLEELQPPPPSQEELDGAAAASAALAAELLGEPAQRLADEIDDKAFEAAVAELEVVTPPVEVVDAGAGT